MPCCALQAPGRGQRRQLGFECRDRIGEGRGGIPLFENCAARLECRAHSQHQAGDHTLFLAEVIEFTSDKNARPLVYHGGQYAELSDTVETG